MQGKPSRSRQNKDCENIGIHTCDRYGINAQQFALTILALVSIISFVADLRGIVYEG